LVPQSISMICNSVFVGDRYWIRACLESAKQKGKKVRELNRGWLLKMFLLLKCVTQRGGNCTHSPFCYMLKVTGWSELHIPHLIMLPDATILKCVFRVMTVLLISAWNVVFYVLCWQIVLLKADVISNSV
jgi:hypothetical protein